MNQTIRARQDVGLPRTEMNKISFISFHLLVRLIQG
jgi:hypothetical protein